MPEKKDDFLTKTVIIATTAIGISLCLITLLIQYLLFPSLNLDNGQKIIVEITPFSVNPSNQEQPEGLDGTTQVTETPSMIGVIAVGMSIKVSGTENEGLRMRSDAGIDQETLFIAPEGESFQIVDGPKILDSLIWWKIQSLNDQEKSGWSVQDYMVPN